MKTIIENDMNSLFTRLSDTLYYAPEYLCTPRGLTIHENLNMTLGIIHPRRRILTIPERKTSYRYLAGELAFYLRGSDLLEDISFYSKFWNNISDNGKTVNSCYGKKLFIPRNDFSLPSFDYARRQLVKDKDSRKAIAIIYTPENEDLDTKDNPCTMFIQFFIRENKLIATTHMRSNDIWFGLTYDIPFFTIVQELMWLNLKKEYPGLELGMYEHIAGSLHVYEKDYKNVEKLIEQNKKDVQVSPKMPEMSEQTIPDLTKFLTLEETYRKGEIVDARDLRNFIIDPFVNELCNWLLEDQYDR